MIIHTIAYILAGARCAIRIKATPVMMGDILSIGRIVIVHIAIDLSSPDCSDPTCTLNRFGIQNRSGRILRHTGDSVRWEKTQLVIDGNPGPPLTLYFVV